MMPIPHWLEEIEQGKPPSNLQVIEKTTAGASVWLDPFISLYLDRFIKGENNIYGSKVKLIISNDGSGGKTHALRYIYNEAQKRNYQAVFLRTEEFRFHYFHEFYGAIIRKLNFESILDKLKHFIIKQLGYVSDDIDNSQAFIPWAESLGEDVNFLSKEMRKEFSKTFLHNPRIDRNFASALINLISNDLKWGKNWDKPERRQALLDWIGADSSLLLSHIKREQIYVRINRQNARRMLCSLAETIRLAGFDGLVICVDELDDLFSTKLPGRGKKYTKMAREDVYESIRELIDDQENLQGILFLFASRREIISDEKCGIKSYPALWMRIQEEVSPQNAFNPYVDLIDLDRLWSIYGKEKITAEISHNLYSLLNNNGGIPIKQPDQDTLQSVLEISPFNIRQAVRIFAAFMRKQLRMH